jgi:predicted RNA-binding protein with PIN domain
MAIVRILVDGYSLLNCWRELAPGRSPFSSHARDALIQRLTLYQDVTHTPITIFFDGVTGGGGTRPARTKADVEVIYSRSGQTADQLIERAACRYREYGEVLAVTNDSAERETVLSLGGLASSCLNFIQTVEGALAESGDELKHYNRRERQRFRSGTGTRRNET